jgi:hypothetical protein
MTVMRAHVFEPTLTGRRFEVLPDRQPQRSVAHLVVWTTFAVVALLLMDVLDLTVYGVVIPVAGVLLALVMARIGPPNPSIAWTRLVVDRADVIAIAVLYVVTVALFRLAFGVFGTDRVAGLFLSFAAALLVGVVGPVIYTTWIRRRPLASIGMGPQNLRRTLRLGLLLAAAHGDQQRPQDEHVLCEPIGDRVDHAQAEQEHHLVRVHPVPHVVQRVQGCGAKDRGRDTEGRLETPLDKPAEEDGLEQADGERHDQQRNPVHRLREVVAPQRDRELDGSFYAQLDSGDLVGELPWASIAGFGDVLVVMALVVWFAHRSERRHRIPRFLPAGGGSWPGRRFAEPPVLLAG